MASKISWVLVGVLAVGLTLSALMWRASEQKRVSLEAEKVQAGKALAEARAAAEKAVHARQESEAARVKFEAELTASKSDLAVALGQAKELKEQLPRLESEAVQARRALADSQRVSPGTTGAPKVERAKPAVVRKHTDGGWSVAEVLPPETLGVVVLRDLPVTLEKAKETGLWRILTGAEFEKVFKLPVGRAQGYLMMGEMMLGEKFSELASLFSQGEITFSILGVERMGPNGNPIPDVLLGIQVRDKADAFMKEFNKRLDQLKAATNGGLTVTQSELGNTRITRLEHPQSPVALNCCLTEGTFLVCVGDGRLQKLLSMREKTKGAVKTPGGAPEVLAQVTAYKRAMEKAGPDADVIVYANVQAIAANPIINAREMTATQKRELEMSGLTEVQAVSYSAGIKDAGIREAFFLDVPANKRHGVLGLIDGESADLNAFYAAPRNAVMAGVFKVSPDKLLDKVVELAAQDNPKAREDVAAGLFFIGETLKIDVKKDLIEALTGQGVFSLSVPAKNAKLALAFPQPVIALQIKNRDGLKSFLTALLATSVDKVQVSEVTENGKSIVIVRQRMGENGNDPAQICYTLGDEKDLLISFYPLALKEELKRRSSDTAKLEQDPDFNQARANLTGQAQAMLYIDTAAIATAAYDVLAPIAQIREKNAQVDLNALPSGEVLNQNLGSALYGLQFAADGIYVEGYSPAGMGVLMIPAAVALPALARARGAARENAAAPPVPGAADNRRAAARAFGVPRVEAQKVDALGKVYRDLKEYAAEHGGNFPAKLDEMKPKYLQDIGQELEFIVYRGKQAADNFVLAHSSEKLPGPIALLLQSGIIQTVQRQQLGKVLLDGMTKETAPDGTKAVKPPKPPDF